jgi:hypothetical protein
MWASERHHLMSWILSVGTASRFYPDTGLVTDTAGAALLVDGLGLRFRTVSCALDGLDGADQEWWVLGKLAAYAAQAAPFVHLDSDVFLWRALPEAVVAAPIFAQNPEEFFFEDQSLYRLEPFMAGITRAGGWLPPEWRWYAEARGRHAVCCGMLGGTRVDFIAHFARQAQAVIAAPDNQSAWPGLGVRDNILVEQYFLAACLEYHRGRAGSAWHDVWPEYLFASSAEAFSAEGATRAGYTHLIGDAKRDAEIAARVERRVRTDHPELFARCEALLARQDRAGAAA